MKSLKYSDYITIVSDSRALLQRVFYSLVIFSFCLAFFFNILVSQIGNNPLPDQDADPVYLLFMITGAVGFMAGWAAPYIEVLMMFCCIGSIMWPLKRMLPAAFLLLYFCYFITYNMVAGHHYTNVGLLVMAVPFLFASHRFVAVFTLCRFFFCFMMFTAACWKIARGNLWHLDQTGMLLINTSLEALVSGDPTWRTEIVRWLVNHKTIAHLIWIFLIVLEAIFLLGFISFRWDKYLLIAYCLFFIGGWFLFDIYNFENLLFLLTLTPVLKFLSALRNKQRSLHSPT
ncbi:MAG: hypothetical protein EOO02_02060 [Chitinophagaceae bacterium]|nr:MAG: hypothetical protein EOO02_02060 [Chitinophagaceae bacterium]